MTSNEINLILSQIQMSTESLATKEQVARIDIKLDNHLAGHKSNSSAAKKLGFILLGTVVAAVVPLLLTFILN